MLSFNWSEINQNLAARYEHKPKLRLHICILFFHSFGSSFMNEWPLSCSIVKPKKLITH